MYLGRMTWEEMMAPFFGVLIDSKTDPASVLKLGRVSRVGRRCVSDRVAWLVGVATIVVLRGARVSAGWR